MGRIATKFATRNFISPLQEFGGGLRGVGGVKEKPANSIRADRVSWVKDFFRSTSR